MYQGCCPSDERATGALGANGVGFAALAASGVEQSVSHVLVNRERFTGDGRLVGSYDGETVVLLVFVVVVAVFLVVFLGGVRILILETLPLRKAFITLFI